MRLNEENYADIAEKVILDLKYKDGKEMPLVTTSKIRNLLAMTASIYNEVQDNQSDQLSKEIIGDINYLRIRCAYEAGRDRDVKNLIVKAEILKHIEDIKGSKQNFLIFSKYMEALVAFRKFYGKRDE